ncbi:polysaccharide biosynthesis/export family protein [Nonlabens sp.]|uniref:polysaccharide biosynthesis/export family protein n=1 Tax=Nonlabens sp. TaxID=1888209 RepID=UPI003F695B2A
MKLIYRLRKVSILLLLLLLSSCVSRKELVYFQDLEQVSKVVEYKNQDILKVNDLLEIIVVSENMNAAKPFNYFAIETNSNGDDQNTFSRPQYVVDSNGEINFPQLGKIKVAGLSQRELENFLEKQLLRYLKDVSVNIKLLNFKFTVLGEVSAPGTFNVPEGKITILQALGLAGDLNIKAKRDNILIIRNAEGSQDTFRIDLTKSDVFASDFYYLQQNDVIVVEPNSAQVRAAGDNTFYTQLALSITSLALTLFIVIDRR